MVSGQLLPWHRCCCNFARGLWSCGKVPFTVVSDSTARTAGRRPRTGLLLAGDSLPAAPVLDAPDSVVDRRGVPPIASAVGAEPGPRETVGKMSAASVAGQRSDRTVAVLLKSAVPFPPNRWPLRTLRTR